MQRDKMYRLLYSLIREHSNNESVLIWKMYNKIWLEFYNCLISSFAFSTVKASGITFLSKTIKYENSLPANSAHLFPNRHLAALSELSRSSPFVSIIITLPDFDNSYKIRIMIRFITIN